MSRVVVQISLGAAESLIVVDDLVATPEVLRDLTVRCREGLAEAVQLYVANGLPGEDMYDDSVETLNELLGGGDGDAE
jgi:hypothetical protein